MLKPLGAGGWTRAKSEIANPVHLLGLLRARCLRPQSSPAAKHRDELTPPHSITSSARLSSAGGIVTPIAFAVVRFTIKSNLIGCSIGISPGFAPFKILSTKSPARLYRSGRFAPQDIKPAASTNSRKGSDVGR